MHAARSKQKKKEKRSLASGKDTDRICGRSFMWQFIFGDTITGTASNTQSRTLLCSIKSFRVK